MPSPLTPRRHAYHRVALRRCIEATLHCAAHLATETMRRLTARATMRRLGTEMTRHLHRCRVRSDLDASFRVADGRAISVGGSGRTVSGTAKATPNFGGTVNGTGQVLDWTMALRPPYGQFFCPVP